MNSPPSTIFPSPVPPILTSQLTVDLDLQIVDSAGSVVAWSTSWNNSYEIAELNAKRGETYDIRICRWSGSDDVRYGVAWTTTGLSLSNELLPTAIGRR